MNKKQNKNKKLSPLEEIAASSWLAGVSLQELAGSDKVSMKMFLLCHRMYTKLDAMAQEEIKINQNRKEMK